MNKNELIYKYENRREELLGEYQNVNERLIKVTHELNVVNQFIYDLKNESEVGE